MNTLEFKTLKDAFPEAMRVWHDRMHDLNKDQLIETLAVHMDMELLAGILGGIEYDITESRTEEGVNDND